MTVSLTISLNYKWPWPLFQNFYFLKCNPVAIIIQWSSILIYSNSVLQICLLVFICNPRVSTLSNSSHSQISAVYRAMENLGHPLHVSTEVEGTVALPSYFSSHSVSKYFFCALFSETFPTFLLVNLLLFKNHPKHSTEVLSSVLMCQKAVVLDKFHSGINMALLVISPMLMNPHYISNQVFLHRNTYKTRLCVDSLMKMLWPEASWTLTMISRVQCSDIQFCSSNFI